MLRESVNAEIDQYVDSYIDALGNLPVVDQILVDASEALTIYTVYRGDLATSARRLFGAEATVRQQFPDKRMRFETVPAEAAGDYFPSLERLHVVYAH